MARAQQIREIEPIDVDVIHVGDRLRAVSEESVAMMADSLAATGLLTPISVRIVDMMMIDGREVLGVPVLIAGATRLAAARRLGWPMIDTITAEVSEVEARRHEIAENLHRSELTAQQRAEHIAEWARLVDISAQVGPKVGRPPSGLNAAARELGVERKEVQRAVRVASISERAKQAAVDAKLDNNQAALLRIASVTPDEQVEKVREEAAERDRRREARKSIPPSDAPRNDFEIINKDHRALVRAWEAARPEAREQFLTDIGAVIDVPVMDRGAA